jgi:hypothetical protein
MQDRITSSFTSPPAFYSDQIRPLLLDSYELIQSFSGRAAARPEGTAAPLPPPTLLKRKQAKGPKGLNCWLSAMGPFSDMPQLRFRPPRLKAVNEKSGFVEKWKILSRASRHGGAGRLGHGCGFGGVVD